MKNVGSYPDVRLRRNRKTEWSRRLVSESSLPPNDLIWPIFIREGKNIKEPAKLLPGVFRYTLDKVENLVEKAINEKIPMIALFPNTPNSKKDAKGSEALNKNNLVCKALRLIKKNYKEIGLMCDVALDPYTNHGHDGLLKKNYVDNDETIKILVKQSILQAEMGCDVIAPSDMMDGRIGKIRKAERYWASKFNTPEEFSKAQRERYSQAVAKMKNSTNTNLLILDEIFDSSLDNTGTDEFLKILNTLGNENVFVISHKQDALADKFRNTIKFEKVKNFSHVVE